MEFFSGLAGGASRKANLLGLVERALEFEAMNSSSLYQFAPILIFLLKRKGLWKKRRFKRQMMR